MEENIIAVSHPSPSIVSKEKNPRPKSPRTHFQLHNVTHKPDLIKLFQSVKPFKLKHESEEHGDDEETRDGSDNEFPESEFPENFTDNNLTDTLISNLNLNDGIGLTCTTCEINFAEVQEQRLHFRLDWHRYNVKRRVHGQRPVDDVQFDEMMDGLSSISGSDNDEESTVSKVQVSRLLHKVEEDDVNEKNEKHVKESRADRKIIRSPKAFYENLNDEILGIYKAIIPSVNHDEKINYEVNLNVFLKSCRKWGVILVSSGHFAGAIFEGGKDIIHKTFHSYTVRAKQGGAESSSGHHKSAGSSLRRHNEASLFQNIQDILEVWKPHLDSCQYIFYRMGSANQNVLFNGRNPPLRKDDPRVRTIPFPTKRPTFSEVKNVFTHISSVQVYSKSAFLEQFVNIKKKKPLVVEEVAIKINAKSKVKKNNKIDRCRSRSPRKREIPGTFLSSSEEFSYDEEELGIIEVDQEIDFTELQEYGDTLSLDERQRRTRMPKRKKHRKPKIEEFQKPEGLTGELLEILKTSTEHLFVERLKQEFRSATELDLINNLLEVLNRPLDQENSTLLHMAAKMTRLDAIWYLLESGSEPTLKDKSGKYAYDCAETKECRNIFRRFRAQYPDKYDYQTSQIPTPLTEEIEREKAEKKRIQNRLKREKEKQKKMERKEKQDEIDEKERFLNLSDREKRALAAEKRILGECKRDGEKVPILVRCFECAIDITGKIPFEYNRNVFCTTKCLAVHRKSFPTHLSV